MTKQMLIGMHLGNGYGSQPQAWRMPGVDPASFDEQVRIAQAAERGKLQFLFLPRGQACAVPSPSRTSVSITAAPRGAAARSGT